MEKIGLQLTQPALSVNQSSVVNQGCSQQIPVTQQVH